MSFNYLNVYTFQHFELSVVMSTDLRQITVDPQKERKCNVA